MSAHQTFRTTSFLLSEKDRVIHETKSQKTAEMIKETLINPGDVPLESVMKEKTFVDDFGYCSPHILQLVDEFLSEYAQDIITGVLMKLQDCMDKQQTARTRQVEFCASGLVSSPLTFLHAVFIITRLRATSQKIHQLLLDKQTLENQRYELKAKYTREKKYLLDRLEELKAAIEEKTLRP